MGLQAMLIHLTEASNVAIGRGTFVGCKKELRMQLSPVRLQYHIQRNVPWVQTPNNSYTRF
jgi:hypothetical protein